MGSPYRKATPNPSKLFYPLPAKMPSTGNLPEDALLEILLRLPVKSLARFRCVSKSWLALFESSQFIDMHLKFSLARDGENLLITRFLKEDEKNLLSIHSNDESLSVLVPNLELQGYSDERLRFTGSCNGIVCFSTHRDIILFNPEIREFRTLPRIPCPEGCYFVTEGMGFGFDPVSNDYKVVKIISIDDGIVLYPDFCKAEIYNLSTDTWRELDIVLPKIMLFVDGSFDLFFNGRIHWRAAEDYDFILSMDISSEEFQKFKFPKADKTIMDENAVDNKSLFVIKNCLALILYTHKYPYPPHPDFEQKINIWLMKEYGVEESWSKQYSIGPLFGILRPMSAWKDEVLLLERVCNRYGDRSYRYDCELVAWDILKNKQVHKYDVCGFECTMGVVFYKESLISVARRT